MVATASRLNATSRDGTATASHIYAELNHFTVDVCSWVLIMVVHLACAWTSDSDRDGDGADCPPLWSQKGARSHSDGISMPERSEAHRAHHQTMHGSSIANSLAHFEVRTNQQTKKKSASTT